MEKLIKSTDDLIIKLCGMHKNRDKSYGSEFVYVDNKVRKEFLLSANQGKLNLSATPTEIIFEDIGGGVYKAYPEYEPEF